MAEQAYDPSSLPDLLPVYYKRLFPYNPYYRWLHYGGVPKNYFSHREFSFTLKDDVYIRYQSFSDQQELEKAIQTRCPYKIDIGAVFSHRKLVEYCSNEKLRYGLQLLPVLVFIELARFGVDSSNFLKPLRLKKMCADMPKDHKTVKAAAFQAQEKELVFDIDMTDYDDVRNCCSGAGICNLCWPLMQIAIRVIDRALRDDFGFEHILWVYSGRRGIHCWVCDETARKLSQNGRSAIAEYLSVVRGGENQTKKVSLPADDLIHPSIRHAIDIIGDHVQDYLVKKQDFLDKEENWEKVLALVQDEEFKKILADDFEKHGVSSKTRWAIVEKRLEQCLKKNLYTKCKNLDKEILLQYTYPRLDVNVSKGVNHLLKSPFCIHPKTGRVCVPIDMEDVENFDPMKVPTVSQLLEELDQAESIETEGKKVKDTKKTSLSSSIQVFEKFLKKLENSWKGKLLEQSDMKREF